MVEGRINMELTEYKAQLYSEFQLRPIVEQQQVHQPLQQVVTLQLLHLPLQGVIQHE